MCGEAHKAAQAQQSTFPMRWELSGLSARKIDGIHRKKEQKAASCADTGKYTAMKKKPWLFSAASENVRRSTESIFKRGIH